MTDLNEKRRNYTYLGYVNGWEETPEIYKECKNKKHKLVEIKTGRCEYKYICDECHLYFFVDSSD